MDKYSPSTQMMSPGQMFPGQLDNDEIDLIELFKAIWNRKWLIALTTVIGAVLAIGIALWLPNIYSSSATLTPSEDQQGGGLTAIASQFGGLASLAGINLGSSSTDKTSVAIQIGQSRRFLVQFVHNHGLEVPLLAAKGYDKNTDSLVINDDIYDSKNNKWIRDVPEGKSIIPTDWELYKEISKVISIEQDKKSGFVTISASYLSPTLVKRWVDWYVLDLNRYMKERDQLDAKRNIEYLNEQLAKTSVADMQTVFYSLIEQQTKTLMLSEANPEYVFKTLDPAVVAEEKSKPKRALIAVLGTILGGMLGVLIALVQHAFASRSRKNG